MFNFDGCNISKSYFPLTTLDDKSTSTYKLHNTLYSVHVALFIWDTFIPNQIDRIIDAFIPNRIVWTNVAIW